MDSPPFKICGFCGTEFQTKKKNQKYCDPVCCRGATNKRIMQRYYENKARLAGLVRICNCGNVLSRYNPSTMCNVCESNARGENDKKIEEMLGVINSKIGKARSSKSIRN